jgi:hypothetical protein
MKTTEYDRSSYAKSEAEDKQWRLVEEEFWKKYNAMGDCPERRARDVKAELGRLWHDLQERTRVAVAEFWKEYNENPAKQKVSPRTQLRKLIYSKQVLYGGEV